MFKTNLLVLIIFLSSSFIILAQKDSTKHGDWQWHWDNLEDWNIDFGFKKSHPAISLNYGLAKLQRKDISTEFVDPNLIELKLGYVKERAVWNSEKIIKQDYHYIYLSNESNKLSGKENSSTGLKYETDMWRFGFGRSSGYGYKLGESSAIIPYNTFTLNWSRIDFKYPNILTDPPLPFVPVPENDILNLYDEFFRFGTSSEGGVRVKVIDNLMFDAGYERSIVFQRHLFWKWAGSVVIETAAQGLLDGFINKIFRSSPAAGPIVNFVLKNALAYGIYELRQEKMNWPFNSEAPIAYDQFKFGITFVF